MAENLKFTNITVTLDPYYTGDDVLLKFTVGDSDGDVNPSTANISILKPDNSEIGPITVTRTGNEVNYRLDGAYTTEKGIYRTYFILLLPTYGERTHGIEFEVKANPERWPE